MGNHHPTAIFKVLSVSTVLMGSVLFGYGLQNQNSNRPGGQQPEANLSQDTGKASPQASPAPSAKAPQSEKKTDSQTASQSKPARRDVDSVSSNRPHFRLGTVVVGAGFSRFPRRSFFSPFVGFGFGVYPYGYSPYYYDPFYGPYYGPYYSPYYPPAAGYGYGRGEIKLSVEPKYARVYLDGAFAGQAEDLKHIYLAPGVHNLSLSAPGRANYAERIYVLSGKTIKIKATLEPEATKPATPTEEKK